RTDVERELEYLHAAEPERLEDSRGEVESCRRRGDRTRRTGVDRLVALAILRRWRRKAADVRRGGRPPAPIEAGLGRDAGRPAERLDDRETVGLDAHDAHARLGRGTDGQLSARAAAPAGPHERAPASLDEGRREQELDRSPSGVPRQDTRRDDPRVVDDETV